MLTLIIKDGLGNQMFQYAFARQLQYLYEQQGTEEPIVINPYFIDHTHATGNDYRTMSIQHLRLNDRVTVMPAEEQKGDMRRFRLRALWASGLWGSIRWRLLKQYDYSEAFYLRRQQEGVYYPYGPYPEYPIILSPRRNKYIFGFFQTERNFADVTSLLKEELKVKEAPSAANSAMLEQMAGVNTVCLHIRRGDYLNPQWKNLQICDYDYYNRAINYLLDHVADPMFYVFSNSHQDLEWIRENYHFMDESGSREIRLVYVDLDNPDYEELRLMYSCKHFIISNSTFSWWGAWLSDHTGKIVCAPRRWNLSHQDDHRIYLKDWVKI